MNKEFNKRIVIGNFVLRRNKGEKVCYKCDGIIDQGDIALFLKRNVVLHPECIFSYIEQDIKDLKLQLEKLKKDKEEYEKTINKYKRMLDNLPLKEQLLNDDIENLKKTSKEIEKVLNEFDLMKEIIIRKL